MSAPGRDPHRPPALDEFVFSDWQADFIHAVVVMAVRAVAIRGGIRSGKSVALVFLSAILARTRPGCMGYLLMDTFGNSRDVHGPICQAILPSTGAVWYASCREWRWPNGSVLRLRAYFRDSTQSIAKNPLEGNTIHYILVDECGKFSTPEVWERANERCSTDAYDLNGNRCPPVVVLSGFPEDPCWWVDVVQDAAEKGARTAEFYPRTTENEANLGDGYIAHIIATHSEEDVEALIHNRPRPRVGQVLSNWSPALWPAGNLVDLEVSRRHPTTVAIDFGFRFPAVAFIQHHELRGADGKVRGVDVVVDELCPDDCLTGDLAASINARGYNIVALVGDPAGGARNAQTGRSDIDELAKPVAQGGLGVRMMVTTDPVKRDIRAGIIRLRKRIHHDGERLLCMVRGLWERGIRDSKRRSIAASIQGYRYSDKGNGEPVKDGRSDHGADCLRYWAIRFHWSEHALDGRLPALTAPEAPKKRAAAVLAHGGTGGRWGSIKGGGM